MNSEKNFVAMTLCFYCGEPSGVVLDKRLKPILAHGVYNMEPCTKCENYMQQGVILISATEESLNEMSEEAKKWEQENHHSPFIPNPWRTGGFWVIKDEAIRRTIKSPEMAEQICRQRWSFIAHEALIDFGLEPKI